MTNVPRGTLPAYEWQELEALMDWARVKKILLVHHANERRCTPRQGAKFKRSGVSAGYPDVSLMIARGGKFGLFIELKQNRTYSASEMNTETWIRQEEWLRRLASEGYEALRCYGWEEARKTIELYTSQSRTLPLP